jgi:hypothetical protein
MTPSTILDLEGWFAAHRQYADFFGCVVRVVDGQLAMICDGGDCDDGGGDDNSSDGNAGRGVRQDGVGRSSDGSSRRRS